MQGCCNQNKNVGLLLQAEIYAEMGEVINGTKEAKCEPYTVFKSVGKWLTIHGEWVTCIDQAFYVDDVVHYCNA